ASPILLELEIPATFFLTSAGLNYPQEYWWDILERVFLSDQDLPPALDLYGDGRWHKRTISRQEKEEALKGLNEMMYSLSEVDRNSIMNRIGAWSGVALSARDTHRPMVAEEVLQLAGRPGHTIGAHTTNHLNLSVQSIPTRLKEIN